MRAFVIGFLLAGVFVFDQSGFSAGFEQESVHAVDSDLEAYCAVPCTNRMFTGRCISYGADYCTPYAGTACVPRCTNRSISGSCLNYGADFCGVYPSCVIHCQNRSITGQCLTYGADQCVAYLW